MKIKKFAVFLWGYLSISFLYSCVFQFIGVHSDSSEGEATLHDQATFLLQNYTTSTISSAESAVSPSIENIGVSHQEEQLDKVTHNTPTTTLNQVKEPVFGVDTVDSSHVDVPNEIINNDTPIVISRIDSATEELQKRANLPSPLPSTKETLTESIESTETNITNQILNAQQEGRSEVNAALENEDENVQTNTTDRNTEDIPSFSEWAQKRLEEAEKEEQVNLSTANITNNITKQSLSAKMRWKNYASVDCGAKVILANPEAQHTWAILVGSRDEYVLNPCSSRIWFIVELCEAIQLKKVELANYELFSSSPKDFVISVGDRFPTRDWSVVGQFTAKDERDVQTFYIDAESFGKYIKVEVKSHYGSEHYCPLSLFRAYGTSVFEVLQKDDPAHEQPIEDDDDDDSLDLNENTQSNNILSSATDAVISMVKKAAQVLGNKVKANDSSQINNNTKSASSIMKSCKSPSHYVICTNCPDTLFGKIFELLSCTHKQIENLVSIPFISKALKRSMVCNSFGIDLRDPMGTSSFKSGSLCVESFFSQSFLGAMCNVLAMVNNKASYNISYQFANNTGNMPGDTFEDVPKEEPKVLLPIEISDKEETIEKHSEHLPTEPLTVERPDINTKSGCSTDTSYTSQIKPSRSVVTELPIYSEISSVPVPADSTEPKSESAEGDTIVDIDISSTEIPTNGEAAGDGNLDGDNMDKVGDFIVEGNAPAVNNIPVPGGVQGQKESVFLRLSNRIKALERNMSLSGQYLEELSKRYKKQVEEMQRVLEKTEKTLQELTSTKDELFRTLEDKVESLTRAMERLSDENESWKAISHWLFFIIAATFLVHCYKRISSAKPAYDSPSKSAEIQRRNSVDVVTRTVTKKKKRRPSDQALKIVTASGDQEKPAKKRKKKTSNPLDGPKCDNEDRFSPLYSSSKIWGKQGSADWVEGRGRVLEDIPFPLEEADSSILEISPSVPELINFEAPEFIRTATNVRQGRSSLRNGRAVEQGGENEKKRHSIPNLFDSLSSDRTPPQQKQSPKKEKKGFRKLFKKVFES